MSDTEIRIASLHLYPVKSCRGIAVDEALVVETGFELDRFWMVVDAEGRFVTQRQMPRMTLVKPTLRGDEVVLRAPGMLALHLSMDAVEEPCRVRVWKDEMPAWDMGDLAAQWFSDFLGRKLRLARFDPAHKRLSNTRWTRGAEAPNAFSDGYPLLVLSSASLAAFNERLNAAGQAGVAIERFRPNLVLDGLDAHGEDFLDEVRFETDTGAVRLRITKPCVRCEIPDIDPDTADASDVVGDVLASYRSDARVDGGITFGMNAVVLEGADCLLRTGQSGSATIRFD